MGAGTAEVFGDYGAGPNHVLPTGGTARYTGGLSALTFIRVRTWMKLDDLAGRVSVRVSALRGPNYTALFELIMTVVMIRRPVATDTRIGHNTFGERLEAERRAAGAVCQSGPKKCAISASRLSRRRSSGKSSARFAVHVVVCRECRVPCLHACTHTVRGPRSSPREVSPRRPRAER